MSWSREGRVRQLRAGRPVAAGAASWPVLRRGQGYPRRPGQRHPGRGHAQSFTKGACAPQAAAAKGGRRGEVEKLVHQTFRDRASMDEFVALITVGAGDDEAAKAGVGDEDSLAGSAGKNEVHVMEIIATPVPPWPQD